MTVYDDAEDMLVDGAASPFKPGDRVEILDAPELGPMSVWRVRLAYAKWPIWRYELSKCPGKWFTADALGHVFEEV